MNTYTYSVGDLEAMMSDPQFAAAMEELVPVIGGVLLGAAAVILILSILMIAALWKIFKKAGTGGWKALIPVYNEYTLFKISWKPRYFWISLLLGLAVSVLGEISAYLSDYAMFFAIAMFACAIIALVIEIKVIFKLAKAFRKGVGFGLGLLFLPVIFYPILGFGKAKYRRKRRHKRPALPAGEENA